MLLRQVNGHQTGSDLNERIIIEGEVRDTNGGSYTYRLHATHPDGAVPDNLGGICFQHGPVKEVGANGISDEALLVILIDRLQGFQEGQFACEPNKQALLDLYSALTWLKIRTQARQARGVEGTHTV